MAISRAQMEQQIKGFNEAGLVTNDPDEIDQAQQDAFDPTQAISGASTIDPRISALSQALACLLYTSPSPRDGLLSRMPSSA